MAAYIVFTREKMRNQAAYENYRPKARAALAGHPVTPRAFYGRYEVVEGAQVEGVVILEFPTFEAAKAFYDSPAYHAARQDRFLGCDYRVVIVEGV